MSFRCLTLFACLFLLTLMPACNDDGDPNAESDPTDTGAAQQEANSDVPGGSAKAVAIMDQAVDYLKSRKKSKVDVMIDIIVQGGGFEQKSTTNCLARFESPNRLAVNVAVDPKEIKAVSDGKNLYVAMLPENKYTVDGAPESFADIGNPFLSGIMQGPISPAVPGSNLYDSIFKDAAEAAYIGAEPIGDIPCDHIRYKQEAVINDVWVGAGDRKVIHKIVQDVSEQMRKMGGASGGHGDFKMERSLHFKNWGIDGDADLGELAFTPAEGMEKVDSLVDAPSSNQPEANELVGSEAPDFALELLDGDSVDLASHRGKNIVILDFWATWCGPCVQAMPTISSVAEAFKEDGVVLYAVNLREPPATIENFLKTNKLNVDVALDSDGKVAALYRAVAIPQTVIVGKEGRIQAVHVGLLPDLEQRLQSELQTLVDGGNLAPAEEMTQEDTTTGNDTADDES